MRFVVLRHEMPAHSERASHWDVMLQHEDRLLTWAIEQPLVAGRSINADRLADHRLEYLDYQGPVSEDRGSVSPWDVGTLNWIEHRPDRIVVSVAGTQLDGELTIWQPAGSQRWRLKLS